jgi:hypothetical protein
MLQITRHWTSNKLGHCQLETCHGSVGDLAHLLITCPALAIVRSRMWEMILTKTAKLVPLNIFVRQIFFSPPDTQLQFFIEPVAFTDIREMCGTYGQTLLDLVYYCARTYVYYIHREKQIMLGKWPGDMTIKTKKDGKTLTFRKTQNQLTNDSSNYTNIVPFTGLHCVGVSIFSILGFKKKSSS